MILIDQEQRDGIIETDGNIVVSASAGSGKTTIMIKKLGIELEKITNHKTIAAITFTVKATDEIKKKAEKNIKKPFITMTNDSFIESEIIRPFIKDALGKDFRNDYIVDYGEEYKFENYPGGLIQLKEKNILGSLKNKKLNFNFKLAYDILEKSIAAREYIKSKYSWIFIDEYQDSDEDMHRFFMKIKNELNIKLFIVGDSKQAIYLWRGAVSNIFELLKNEKFNFYELITNFRCDREIENYANLFHNPQYFVSSNNNSNNVILKKYSKGISGIKYFIDEFKIIVSDKIIDLNKEITIIANYNNDAKKITKLLNEEGFDFIFIPKTPIDEGIPNGYLLKELAKFYKNSTYTIYDFLEKVKIDERTSTRKEINSIIGKLKGNEHLNENMVEGIVFQLAKYLGVSIDKCEIDKFCESIFNSEYDLAFRLIDSKHKVMTVFASKGLEFDQVISFTRYYEIYKNENLQNHYVCITRAKEKLIMFIDNEEYYTYVKNIAHSNGVKDMRNIIRYE
ncbi:UvrD/REP helicase [[Clostridium] sordellii]|uniref:UvrD-helicase domain-containing protein n=1 Tax=Paraclostridium sordellii TaxID=1505 RepID=UPI0005E71561|nr:UvrD-helicase domain-containing protein [Paeniclostridium sordellii]CEQ06501.1 UvrD/REP helicase [[Clostridium] sordellii] [Paeniclostridium sordellii]